uniref:Uncharacterized protein n=1 Tax=Esox lucius TaxID=8010 RepID=A0A6Q2WTA3_ESOLU
AEPITTTLHTTMGARGAFPVFPIPVISPLDNDKENLLTGDTMDLGGESIWDIWDKTKHYNDETFQEEYMDQEDGIPTSLLTLEDPGTTVTNLKTVPVAPDALLSVQELDMCEEVMVTVTWVVTNKDRLTTEPINRNFILDPTDLGGKPNNPRTRKFTEDETTPKPIYKKAKIEVEPEDSENTALRQEVSELRQDCLQHERFGSLCCQIHRAVRDQTLATPGYSTDSIRQYQHFGQVTK